MDDGCRPVGFKSTRLYPSYVTGDKILYTSEIVDGGDAPAFQVTASDDLKNPLRADRPSGVWGLVHARLQKINPKTSRSCNGTNLFGLTDLGVIKAIERYNASCNPTPHHPSIHHPPDHRRTRISNS
jgi:hypothetical protein